MNRRYDKRIIEPFALNTLAKSFDNRFNLYYKPENTDNFDFISLDNKRALEVVSVVSKNEMNAYVYENELLKGKQNLNTKNIKEARLNDDGSLQRYYGASIQELLSLIEERTEKKNTKAIIRAESSSFEVVDLCLCVDDGGLLDLNSCNALNFKSYIFNNIFIITSSCFLCYNKLSGFKEYRRVI